MAARDFLPTVTCRCWKDVHSLFSDTKKSARVSLFCLQASAMILAAPLWWTPLIFEKPCEKLPRWGICDCQATDDRRSCFGYQSVYRMEASATLVFASLLILSTSRFSRHASICLPGAKAAALILGFFVLLVVPNTWLTTFASGASIAAIAFLVAQAVMLSRFGYAWNNAWQSYAELRLLQLDERGYRRWLLAIVVAAMSFCLLSLMGCILLCVFFARTAERAFAMAVFGTGCVLLLLSITEWCQHGALLTSSVVLAYVMWLTYDTMSMLSLEDGSVAPVLARASGVALCMFTLLTHSCYENKRGLTSSSEDALAEQGQLGNESLAVPEQPQESNTSDADLDTGDFAMSCTIHAVASIYIASLFAPLDSNRMFFMRAAAVVLSLVVYCGTLVMPYIRSSVSSTENDRPVGENP